MSTKGLNALVAWPDVRELARSLMDEAEEPGWKGLSKEALRRIAEYSGEFDLELAARGAKEAMQARPDPMLEAVLDAISWMLKLAGLASDDLREGRKLWTSYAHGAFISYQDAKLPEGEALRVVVSLKDLLSGENFVVLDRRPTDSGYPFVEGGFPISYDEARLFFR